MTENKADPLTQVFARFQHAIIGSDLYIGVEAWPRGAWSVKVPDEGRAIFEAWLSDLEAARAALAAPQPPPDYHLPDWDDVRGIAPNATGNLSSEAFVRDLREQWPDRQQDIPAAPQPAVPLGGREALPEFEDPRVQIAYKMLCDDDLNIPPNREEHWEGWVSRNIVAALANMDQTAIQERGVDRVAIIDECVKAAEIAFEESVSSGTGGVAMAMINAIRALGKETGQ